VTARGCVRSVNLENGAGRSIERPRAPEIAVFGRRAMALEQVGMVALNDYRGDLACSSFREAADLRAEYAPMDRMAIARVCARAVEVPMRWPGSMMHVPPEEEVRRYLDLGIANVGDGDSEELVRLLLAGAFAAYAFGPRRAIADGEYERGRADAERAADMAMRLRRPDLASASLDAAGATLWPRGLYGASLSIIRRRLELAETSADAARTSRPRRPVIGKACDTVT